MRRVNPVGWASVLTAAAGLCVGVSGARAQGDRPPEQDPVASFLSQGVRSSAVAGGLGMSSDVATLWTSSVRGQSVQRVVLEGAVHLEIGGTSFDAARAVLWISRAGAAHGGTPTRQVFAYLEEVGSRQGPPGSTAKTLTVSGVVTGKVRLASGVVRQRAEVPKRNKEWVGLVERGDEALEEFYAPTPTDQPVARARRAFSRTGRAPQRWPAPLPSVEVAQDDAGGDGGAGEGAEGAVKPRTPKPRRARTPKARVTGKPIVGGGVRRDVDEAQGAKADTTKADATKTETTLTDTTRTDTPRGDGQRVASEQVDPKAGEMAPMNGAEVGGGGATPMQPGGATGGGAGGIHAGGGGGVWPPRGGGNASVPGARLRGDRAAQGGKVLPESDSDLGTVMLPGSGRLVSAGVLTFSAEDIAIVGSEHEGDERTILLSGGVGLELSGTRTKKQGRTMTAQRAVVFLTPGTLAELGQVARADVLGIYLEGEAVMQDSRSTQRGSRLYYNVEADRALVLDGVLSTREPRTGTPLYVRAKSIRREGERQFVAERATIANTSFAKPHVSIGARKVIVEQYQREVDGSIVTGNKVDARNLTLNAASLPVLWFPRWVGDPERVPLRGLGFETSNSEGFAVKTTWDAWVLAGLEPPRGVEAELLVDVYEKRGLGLGGLVSWKRPTFEGRAFGYVLPSDNGVDDLRSGEEFDQDGRLRGTIIAENRWDIDENWTLRLEGTHISDQRFLESVFDEDFRDRREFTTRGLLTRRGEQTLFEAELAHRFDDFVSNEYLLLSKGYTVDRLPEIRFTRLNTDLMGDLAPGVLTYNAEVRAGQLGLNFDDVRASERGLRRSFESMRLFGTPAEGSIGDRLRGSGLNEKPVWRFDTRHELSMPMTFGANGGFHVTPFVVGRLTTYDSDFSGLSPHEDDRTRLWGAAGVRLATTLSRVDDSIESRTFDLHRVRHVIEPGITLWHAGTTIDSVNLPIYDEEVESLVEGSMVRVGIDQKWQTQRGGPGRWRSVDVFTLRAEWVWSSDDVDSQSPIGRYFEDRPEFSNPGEFYNLEALWQVSDAVGLAGRVVHDIDQREASYVTGGVVINHGGEFYTTFDVRRVEAIDATVLGTTASYALTPKYRLFADASYDTVSGDFERISAGVDRAFPNVSLRASIRHNNTQGDTSFGITIAPRGIPSGGFGFSGIGGQGGGRSISR